MLCALLKTKVATAAPASLCHPRWRRALSPNSALSYREPKKAPIKNAAQTELPKNPRTVIGPRVLWRSGKSAQFCCGLKPW
jgi:hypothetical protein